MRYDCLIVGGGFAGLQAAIQLGRYRHSVAVIDAAEGRSSICKSYHNLIGFPNGISGSELIAAGKLQAEQLGVSFIKAKASQAHQMANGIHIISTEKQNFYGKRLLIATGVKDRLPDFPDLYPCMGISVFICPDCDGYEVTNQPTLVIGSGDAGARMALTLMHWTSELIYVNHEQVALNEELHNQLISKKITYLNESIRTVLTEYSQFLGIHLEDGSIISRKHCFVAMGGNHVQSELAKQLRAELTDNHHIVVDPRTKQTSSRYVWAAGDVTAHSEMVTIAMGDGSQAAIWMHKSLIST
ncbi:NAD(P)/FAD-dependent oxidoreductase [Paenibacillus luteus]|uniref:NAD(P)/FAD-dependent oxidoreductase n=1 Tax=Paenibacillus luteus TaxID=2545753 RepID=UPI00114512FD|nr:NAD(P)/FAD-dependent oxidoreductase [Paenibacillus luteus]